MTPNILVHWSPGNIGAEVMNFLPNKASSFHSGSRHLIIGAIGSKRLTVDWVSGLIHQALVFS
jgi:hypothetical protein